MIFITYRINVLTYEIMLLVTHQFSLWSLDVFYNIVVLRYFVNILCTWIFCYFGYKFAFYNIYFCV